MANFIDKTGLAYFFSKLKTIFALKSEVPSTTSIEKTLTVSGWSNNIYTVEDAFFTNTSTLVCDLVIPENTSEQEIKALKLNFSLIYNGETQDGKAIFYATSAPTVDLTIQLLVPNTDTMILVDESEF